MRAHPVFFYISSVIRQKANLKTDVSRKQSTSNFPKNEHFLLIDTHTYMCVWGIRNIRFSEILSYFVFLKPLALLPYYRRFDVWFDDLIWHYRISLLLEFLTAERDWKFRMFDTALTMNWFECSTIESALWI